MYYPDLKKEIDKSIHARDLHAHVAHINAYPQFFSPAQRAWAVWALSKMSFASMLDGTFGYDFAGSMPKKVNNAKDEFTEKICRRLEHVTIESHDAMDVIKTNDSPGSFHFVDPPYVNSDCGHYEGLFNEVKLQMLLELLASIKGKFMLTMFPYKAIEDAAQKHSWHIHKILRTISASKTDRRKQEEWIIMNYAETQPASLFG